MASTTPEQLRGIWPQGPPHAALLRELAALLSEDPDNRLRVHHAEALLQLRLGPGAQAAPLATALAEAPPFLLLQQAPGGDAKAAVVRLDAAALAAALDAEAAKRTAAAAAAAAAVSDDASEEERLEAAIVVAWPDAEGDDNDYLARAIAGALLRHQDAKGQLPRHTLHLTDIGSHLRTGAASDARLAAIFPRNRDQAAALGATAAGAAAARRLSNGSSGGSGKDAKPKPRLSEFVAQPRCSAYFRIAESQVRKGEKVLVLLTDALLARLVKQQQAALQEPLLQEQQAQDGALEAEADAPVAAPQGAASLGGPAGLLASPALGDAAAPLWAPLGLGGTPCSSTPARGWGVGAAAAAPITPDCSSLGGLPHRAGLSAFGTAPPGGRASLAGDGGGDVGSRCLFGERQPHGQAAAAAAGGLYRGGGLFGSGDVGEALGTPGLGPRGELEPITPAAFGAARWGSGVAPGSAPGAGAPLPVLQPLVGSFSMGTGLGLGTLLRGFGTDADGGGLAGGDAAGPGGCFGGGAGGGVPGALGDAPLFGGPPGHAPWASGLQLGSSPLDLVPRSIASVWGVPEAAGGAVTRGEPHAWPDGGAAAVGRRCDEPQQQHPGGGQPQQPQPQPPRAPKQQQEQQQAPKGGAGRGAGGAAEAGEGEELDAEAAAAMSNSGSSGGLLSLRGMGGGAAAAVDSSVPDTESSSSPVSAAGSEAQPDSGGGSGGGGSAHLEAMVAVAAATMAVCREEDEDELREEEVAGEEEEAGGEEDVPGGGDAGAASPAGSTDADPAADAAAAASEGGEGDGDGAAAEGGSTGADAEAEPEAGAGGAAPRLTGWALVAAKTPPKPLKGPGAAQASVPRSAPAPKDPAAAASALGSASALAGGALARRGDAARAPLSRLHPGVREEVERLIAALGGVVRPEDFDEGVVHQLNAKRTWEEAAEAVRHLSSYDLAPIQHPAAYINHIIKHFTPGVAGGVGGVGSGGGGAASGQIRLASVPISTKAMLHKCGVRVYRRVEEAVASSSHLQWHHFDAGVVKVLAELAKLSEEDVFEELEALKRSDLKSLQHVPAYLNKRLNNRLWQRRKARGD